MGFALKSRPSLMVSVADYLQDKGELEKAVQLYQKAGEVTKALDLCFRSGAGGGDADQKQGSEGEGERSPAMFEALKSMMDDLGSHASPQVGSAWSMRRSNRCGGGNVWVVVAPNTSRLPKETTRCHALKEGSGSSVGTSSSNPGERQPSRTSMGDAFVRSKRNSIHSGFRTSGWNRVWETNFLPGSYSGYKVRWLLNRGMHNTPWKS